MSTRIIGNNLAIILNQTNTHSSKIRSLQIRFSPSSFYLSRKNLSNLVTQTYAPANRKASDLTHSHNPADLQYTLVNLDRGIELAEPNRLHYAAV